MHLAPSWHRWTPLIVTCAVALAITVAVLRTPERRPVIAPPDALGVQPEPLRADAVARAAPTVAAASPAAPMASLPPGAALVAGQLALYTTDGSYTPEQLAGLAPALTEALGYVEQRTGMRLAAPVSVTFEPTDGCGVSGVTFSERRTIVLYACTELPAQRAVNILAHELVHQLAHDHFGDAHLRADLALSEGLATWGAGRYWLGGEADFRGFVGRHYADALLPLGSHYRDYAGIEAMNRLYYEWAALVEYIRQTHGREAFDRLYASGSGAQPDSADYTGVLGADLAGLEREWQAWVTR